MGSRKAHGVQVNRTALQARMVGADRKSRRPHMAGAVMFNTEVRDVHGISQVEQALAKVPDNFVLSSKLPSLR